MNQESPSVIFAQKTFRQDKVHKNEEDSVDYADILKIREYGNYEKRLRKAMDIRNQSNHNVKLKNWTRYLRINNKKEESHHAYSLLQPSLITPRNEYPILS